MGLWQGSAGDGVAYGSTGMAIFAGLDDGFRHACVAAAELATGLGRSERVLQSLHMAVRMAPLHERVQASLIAVLAVAGRPGRCRCPGPSAPGRSRNWRWCGKRWNRHSPDRRGSCSSKENPKRARPACLRRPVPRRTGLARSLSGPVAVPRIGGGPPPHPAGSGGVSDDAHTSAPGPRAL
ncbi:BTAD domain-containing putative transcriptional regulator [Streptomyces adustus]